jgi:uncharacterized protein YndB with AHSA1/START domain
VEVRAARSIASPPERVFNLLETFDHHLDLVSERVERLERYQEGPRVRLRGPLGVSRTVRTRLTYARRPESIVGRIDAGGRTRGTVRWSIQRSGAGSWVQVEGRAEALGWMDRLLAILGGRRWLNRSIELALERLDERVQ